MNKAVAILGPPREIIRWWPTEVVGKPTSSNQTPLTGRVRIGVLQQAVLNGLGSLKMRIVMHMFTKLRLVVDPLRSAEQLR